MSKIHATAIVDAHAELDSSVIVGPYTVIGPHVKIGVNCSIGPHTVIEGHTEIGQGNRIFQFVSIGAAPQDKKYSGEPTQLVIGNNNTIREFCTINTGTVQDLGVTTLGDDNWIMAYVHIAHDCTIGNHTILANSVQLAGHVHIEDWAILGGLSGVHQFVRIGAHSMCGFSSRINQDLPPFITAAGNPVSVQGINSEGLKRRGFSESRIATIKQMQRVLYRQGLTLAQAQNAIYELPANSDEQEDAKMLLDFLAQSKRGIVR